MRSAALRTACVVGVRPCRFLTCATTSAHECPSAQRRCAFAACRGRGPCGCKESTTFTMAERTGPAKQERTRKGSEETIPQIHKRTRTAKLQKDANKHDKPRGTSFKILTPPEETQSRTARSNVFTTSDWVTTNEKKNGSLINERRKMSALKACITSQMNIEELATHDLT